MKSRFLLMFLAFIGLSLQLSAQRKMEKLDRGVVAIGKGSDLFISWRFFATDPEDIAFNVYRQFEGQAATKLNTTPITQSTNYVHRNAGLLGFNARIFVRPVLNSVEGAEEGSWNYLANSTHRIVQDFDFNHFPGDTSYIMKFCWPADLNGDGKYDFVMDRQAYGAVSEDGEGGSLSYPSPYIEAYDHSGTFKWRIKVGPNVPICNGHSDMVVAYDMDGDGKAEVLMKSSEGTTFANSTVITGAGGGVKDYRATNEVAPHYISIINGETGCEIDRIQMPNEDMLTKPLYGEWGYKQLSGHFAIAYLDGIHPSLLFEQSNRNSDKSFNFMVTAWDYKNGQLEQRWNWVDRNLQYSHFHQIRVADVDGDGYDEMIEGSFVLDHDGTPLFNTDLVHGDRHRTSDIDPDRPGLETFAIQQDNMSTLGMAVYDAATGEMIKRWYQSSVGDVGRGEAIDMDNTSRGMEMYSTMHGYYDAKGNMLADKSTLQPAEGIWWDGDLSREILQPIGKDGFNIAINKWNSTTKDFIRETPNLYNEKEAYYTKAAYGGRPAFFGDILGDWREELILMRRDATGFCVISNWAETNNRLYCLMQNPGYRMQATTKGYYQSPLTDYYLASDMPAPPVAPVQSANLYYTSGNDIASAAYVDSSEVSASFIDGKSLMFDVRGARDSINISSNIAPKKFFIISPKGKDYTFFGSGKLTGSMDLVKSLQGTLTVNGNHTYTGKTKISEGKLILNGSLASKVYVGARGIIAGNASLSGGIVLEEGLNYLGGRIEPGNGCEADKLGSITIAGDVSGKGRNCFAFDVVPGSAKINDSIHIIGNFNVTGTNNTLDIAFKNNAYTSGTYTLITFTGTTNAQISSFQVRGLTGIPYDVIIEPKAVKIQVYDSRNAAAVTWTGKQSGTWDFKAQNFKLLNNSDTNFAPLDDVTFDDNATAKNISVSEVMPVAKATFNLSTSTYSISGSGGIGGTCELKQTGTGTLKLNTANTYTGSTLLHGGVTEVQNISNTGEASSVGSGSTVSLSNVTLKLLGSGASATNRTFNMAGSVTLDIPNTTSTLAVTSNISGANADFVKTGTGLLNLQGNNTFKSVKLKEGTIFLGSIEGSKFGFGNAAVTLEGGTLRLLDINQTSNVGPSAFNIIVPENATGKIEASSRWQMTGALTGRGTLELHIPYIRFDLKGDWSAFEGTIKAVKKSSGLTSSTVGEFRIANDYGYEKATVHLSPNITMYHTTTSGKTIKIGALSGDVGANMTGGNTWELGGNNTSATYGGSISDNGKITKVGSGTQTFTNTSSSIGAVSVNDGVLEFTHSNTLNINGAYANAATTKLSAASTLRVNGTFTNSAGGIVDITLPSDNTAQLIVTNATLDGTLRVTGSMPTYTAATKSSALSSSKRLVLTSTNVITGNFTAIEVSGSAPNFPSYIGYTSEKSAGGRQCQVGIGLKWMAGLSGDFDVPDIFEINTPLSNVSSNIAGWDGKSLSKYGTGRLTISSASTYSGETHVNAGTLTVANSTGSATGNSNVYVHSSASLGGNGTIGGNLSIMDNATLDMESQSSEVLIVEGDITFSSLSTLKIDVHIGYREADYIGSNGIITLAGNLHLTPEENGIFKVGNRFRIFDAYKIKGTFTSITPALPAGLAWDLSQLNSEGIIKIKEADIPLSVGEFDNSNITVYPNPINGNDCYINLNGINGKVLVECISLNGQIMQKEEINSSGGIERINLTGINSCTFLLRVSLSENVLTCQKITKK